MNRTMGSGDPGRPGWLIVRTDATILAADEAACALLGAPGPAGLAGRTWTSLVAHADAPALAEVAAALAAGRPWRGLLRFVYRIEPNPLLLEVSPADLARGVALFQLTAPSTAEPPAPAAAAAAADADLRAQLAAHEALRALTDEGATARAVLQALHTVVPFDWAAVLRFTPGETPGAAVIAVYPAPMAGVGPGSTWSPLDAPEAGVLRSGEPELSGDLPRDPQARSPLARLPAFGMRSRLHLPLFGGGRVAGCLVVYAAAPHALGTAQGILLEHVARALGERLAAAPAPPPAVPAVPRPLPPPAIEPPAATPVTPPPEDAMADQNARLSALGELISGVAHELNNPLTAILGYAQIFNSLDGAERDHAVSTIEQEAQRAARIVRNLLSFARQEPLRSAPVDLEEVLRRVIELRRYSLEVDNVRVLTRFAGIPLLLLDATQLERVFLNLVNNAQQALQPGGGEITISTATTDGSVRISVADDGPGVPEQLRGRIFEPFFTMRADSGGEGMGLSTVYGVVAEHGGRVWVEPSPSGGANFVIELPLADASPPVPPPGPPPRGTERVLIVDDEAPIRALTSEILGAAGYHVTTAAGGDEALRRLEAAAFDLVVADIRMPGMDGVALYARIGERWPRLRGRMLFITGDVEGERTSRRLAQGDVRYLEKPFDTGALLRAVRAALDAAETP